MKIRYVIIILFAINACLVGQKSPVDKVIELLDSAQLDTVKLRSVLNANIERGIAKKHKVYSSEYRNINDTIANANAGDWFGPYYESDSVVFYKAICADSMKVARAGNIWIDKKRGLQNAKAKAADILREIKEGKEFNTSCLLYSDDKNMRKDCDIGWFFYSSMVAPFAEAVFAHKKGDVFTVQTKFGYHVVKMLDHIRVEKYAMTYIKIAIAQS